MPTIRDLLYAEFALECLLLLLHLPADMASKRDSRRQHICTEKKGLIQACSDETQTSPVTNVKVGE